MKASQSRSWVAFPVNFKSTFLQVRTQQSKPHSWDRPAPPAPNKCKTTQVLVMTKAKAAAALTSALQSLVRAAWCQWSAFITKLRRLSVQPGPVRVNGSLCRQGRSLSSHSQSWPCRSPIHCSLPPPDNSLRHRNSSSEAAGRGQRRGPRF